MWSQKWVLEVACKYQNFLREHASRPPSLKICCYSDKNTTLVPPPLTKILNESLTTNQYHVYTLDVHAVLNIACLTSLKIAIALSCIISYRAHLSSSFDPAHAAWLCLSANPFHDSLGRHTCSLSVRRYVIQKNHSCLLYFSLLDLFYQYAVGLANQPPLTQCGLQWIHGGGWLERPS